MDDVIMLMCSAHVKDEYGIDHEEMTAKQVFCKAEYVSRSEFFGGGRNGLNPEFKFVIFAGDYNGESVCQYNGRSYAIYRTYVVPGDDYIELYAERQGGRNGKAAAEG